MNKYLITKYVHAKNINSAIAAEKKATISQITIIGEPEAPPKFGF